MMVEIAFTAWINLFHFCLGRVGLERACNDKSLPNMFDYTGGPTWVVSFSRFPLGRVGSFHSPNTILDSITYRSQSLRNSPRN